MRSKQWQQACGAGGSVRSADSPCTGMKAKGHARCGARRMAGHGASRRRFGSRKAEKERQRRVGRRDETVGKWGLRR